MITMICGESLLSRYASMFALIIRFKVTYCTAFATCESKTAHKAPKCINPDPFRDWSGTNCHVPMIPMQIMFLFNQVIPWIHITQFRDTDIQNIRQQYSVKCFLIYLFIFELFFPL